MSEWVSPDWSTSGAWTAATSHVVFASNDNSSDWLLLPDPPQRPETALEWLDRRVAEMRVPL